MNASAFTAEVRNFFFDDASTIALIPPTHKVTDVKVSSKPSDLASNRIRLTVIAEPRQP